MGRPQGFRNRSLKPFGTRRTCRPGARHSLSQISENRGLPKISFALAYRPAFAACSRRTNDRIDAFCCDTWVSGRPGWDLHPSGTPPLHGVHPLQTALTRRSAQYCQSPQVRSEIGEFVQILGIVSETHDAGIALLREGVPVLVLDEERLNRRSALASSRRHDHPTRRLQLWAASPHD
jgi:hypothetical protein